MHVLGFIFRNLDAYRRRFLLILLTHFANGVVVFMIPVLLAEFTKQDFTAGRLVRLLTVIVVLYATGLGLQWIGRYYGEALAFQFGNHIRAKYFRQVEQLSLQRLQKHHSGYVLSLMNKIGDGLDFIMFEIPWLFASGLATILLFFFFTARESWWLAFVNLFLLFAFVTIGTLLARHMVPLATEQNKRQASLLGSYADFMANIITVKKLGVQRFAENTIDEKTHLVADQIDRVQFFHAKRWLILHGLYGLAYLSTIGFILWGVARGDISSSILILFVSAYITIRSLIERLSENIKSYMEMGAYITTLQDILGDLDDEQGSLGHHHQTKISRFKSPDKRSGEWSEWQSITFRDVVFKHEGGNQALTVDEFTLHKHDRVCITGKSGQGKSTFLNLLTNQLAPQQGERLLDGTSYSDVGADFFADTIAVISQDVDLFSISLRQNLTLGQEIDDERIVSLLKQVDLGTWLEGLDDGLDTIIGEKGITLSAGQKQRLNIVRGVLLAREIYILDEPTAHLDTATEATVIAFLKKQLRGKTIVIVTHRPALHALCNKKFAVKDHRLTAVRSADSQVTRARTVR